MKRMRLILFACLCLLLSGCAAPVETPNASPTPPVVDAPEVEAQGKLADAARRLLDNYAAQLDKIAPLCQNNLTYTIPGDILSKMAQDAEDLDAAPQAGRYIFTWRQSGNHVYQADGLEVLEEIQENTTDTPLDVYEEAPMGGILGDFESAGGGQFDRVYAYDVAEDLSGGSAEITATLNGEATGHERFTFSVRDGALYFVDVAMDSAAELDFLYTGGTYLVAAGVLRKDSVDIVEYHVSDLNDVPLAATLDWDALLRAITPVSRLTAQGDQVQVK